MITFDSHVQSPFIHHSQTGGPGHWRVLLLNEGRVREAIKPQRDWLVPSPVELLPRPKQRPNTTP